MKCIEIDLNPDTSNLTLEETVELQKNTFHWYPYQRVLYLNDDSGTIFERQCPPNTTAIENFWTFTTREQRLQGWIACHIAISLYLFIVLAFICDKYFLPSVERICEVLKITPDVAASTFMATATTTPEFFNNTISIFIADSDMGLGAVVGSMLFNTLGVAASAAMFTKKPIQIDWWPITRDSILFSINLSILVIFAWDGVIMWWETCILVTLYVDPPMKRERRKSFDLSRIDEVDEEEFKIWEIPRGVGWFDIFWYFFTWPIRFILYYTIPNPITQKKWFAASFVICILWIGIVAYIIFWMVVIIGDTFGIPDAIMGFTLLAFGGCMPEAISAVIVARKGSGQMGVSNALGANNLAVLFSLGLPWFIRTMVDGAGFNDAFIQIYSFGIEFTIMTLILAVACLYATIAIAGYKLRKTVGGFLAIFYIIFATFAILVELEFFLSPSERCP
ncbi:CLUMA_CG002559, isoform A [Clunio marinus]|uniref:CLUMA_CG002559, isoform A n=1 Tax=Clunio marinus TaxID=568069 RepID=A0A1J1HR71_9DIPT|nr:CLUMA_CG002559, isoform A [Clunio marinus]